MRSAVFDAQDFRRRVLDRGSDGLEIETGDDLLRGDNAQLVERQGAREAAVLVPVVDRPDGASVILTTRSQGLRNHSGQVSFPGGSIDPTDASPEAAALREAFEEIALAPERIEIVGRLPRYRTSSGFRITPVLAVVRPPFDLRPDPVEVANVFEVPLDFLMNEANHARESRHWQGRERHYYTMPFGEHFIWGVTAGILRTLYERLYV